MPLVEKSLGEVLAHIYDFPLEAAIYLPEVVRYEAVTPCVVAWSATNDPLDEAALHQNCLRYGLKNWLNVAVVSDTCDEVPDHCQENLIAAFNADCREGCWLWKMLNNRGTPP